MGGGWLTLPSDQDARDRRMDAAGPGGNRADPRDRRRSGVALAGWPVSPTGDWIAGPP